VGRGVVFGAVKLDSIGFAFRNYLRVAVLEDFERPPAREDLEFCFVDEPGVRAVRQPQRDSLCLPTVPVVGYNAKIPRRLAESGRLRKTAGLVRLRTALQGRGAWDGVSDFRRLFVVTRWMTWAAVFLMAAATAGAQNPGPRGRLVASQVAAQVRDYRLNNEDRIVRELTEFLAIPNVASDTVNIQNNAARLVEMLEARGIKTHLLAIAGRGPVVFAELATAEAKRTVIFYAHYDGQPVDAAAWTDGKPFEPALRDAAIETGGKRIPFPENSATHPADYKDDWRIYARSSSDDKSPIVALLAALDALRAKRIPLGVNLKVILEGEEEAGSTNLERTLQLHKNLLGADLLITGDGPVHPSGRPLIFFGNRGDIGLDITVYGPVRALHSGHYGNWAPNPAMELSRLLAAMKDANGRVLIDGYYDDVVPLSWLEKEWLAKMPDNDAELEHELGIAKPEGGGKKLAELLQEPSLNIRGFSSAYVGEHAQNVVPDKAQASIDARLVKGEDPRKKYEQIVGFIRKQGYFVVDREPTMEERREHALIAKITDEGGYRASRTAMDLPVSKAMIQLVQDATAGKAVIAPGLGGSVPMYIFEDLGMPWIGVPIVNYDNHQHSSDENLRLGHLWNGIELYAAILADLDW
jgi:acetylornithine deacetylase/succinyl-diaminopimelate desuccinylase-like protein